MQEIQILLQSPVTLSLLVANILLSVSALGNERVMDGLMFDVNRIRRHREWYRFVTSAFIHGGPLHLFVNMYALYGFGPVFEGSLGSVSFAGMYFLSLLGGSAWTWMEHFRDPNYRAVGASGAISGLAIAFAMFAPLAQFLFLFVFPMPAFIFAFAYIAISAWASSSNVRDGLGHSAHLGGALAGAAYVCIFYNYVPQRMIDTIVQSVQGG